jgi:hypothetical protein
MNKYGIYESVTRGHIMMRSVVEAESAKDALVRFMSGIWKHKMTWMERMLCREIDGKNTRLVFYAAPEMSGCSIGDCTEWHGSKTGPTEGGYGLWFGRDMPAGFEPVGLSELEELVRSSAMVQ